MFVAAKLVPRLMTRVGLMGNEELYLLVVLALGFATAAVTQAVGLSLALGAFLAGLIVSESGTTRKMLDMLLPLRDAFVALFFVTIGVLVDPRVLISKPSLVGHDCDSDHAWKIRGLDRGGLVVSVSTTNRFAGRPGTYPDRRILLCSCRRRPRCEGRNRRRLPRNAGSVRHHYSSKWLINESLAEEGGYRGLNRPDQA